MKQSFNFLIRLSIINFVFFALIVSFLSGQKVPTPVSSLGTNQSKPQTSLFVSPTTSPVSNTAIKQALTQTPTPLVGAPQDPLASLSSHNSQSDCWIGYEGSIYNITSFFGSHPGGDAIMLRYCGQDATAAFNSKDKNPPIPHSGNARSMLAQFLVK